MFEDVSHYVSGGGGLCAFKNHVDDEVDVTDIDGTVTIEEGANVIQK